MKKRFLSYISIALVCILIMACVPVSVFAASDFVVQNGVLVEYNGNSKNVVIPADVYYISDSVFHDNTIIESVDLNNVTIIGNNAFRGCTSLKKVTEYDGVASCGAYAFYRTPFLSSYSGTDLVLGSVLIASKGTGAYILPATVKSIAPYAFSGNESITSVTIGQGAASVGEGAFWKCKNLKSVKVGTDVNYIGPYAFEGTAYLTAAKDEFLVLGNGILIRYNGTKTDVTIPDNVKQIAAGAFYNNTKINRVDIPKSVSGIGMRAFAGATALKTVSLPDNLVLLDKEAFSGCESLSDITVPASVEVVGESAFLGCKGLKTSKYFSSAPVSRGLFAGCTSLEAVMISSEVESVEDLAFYNCTALRVMSLPPTVSSIADSSFKNCPNLSVWTDSKSTTATLLNNLNVRNFEIGDVNQDSTVNIKDTTHIQKATAGMLTLDFIQTLKADTDFNSIVNVRDATWIQKRLAGIL